ncbi:MAG: hypothetical protein QM597_09550 [Aeromicrobium sp.]|uniref:hypothetical protein n=1 Tax=Aeromicrobium sp. TaxID=1871063 RepID=UPI0039E63452
MTPDPHAVSIPPAPAPEVPAPVPVLPAPAGQASGVRRLKPLLLGVLLGLVAGAAGSLVLALWILPGLFGSIL